MKRYVISLGGSLLYLNANLRKDYIKKFVELIREYYRKGYWFGIVVGGGWLARYYQKILDDLDSESKDWVGIRATHLNAEILRSYLKDIAYERTITSFENIPRTDKILICGGWEPGCSTDYDAVYLASILNIPIVVNLTKVDGIYDKDPTKYPDAKLLTDLTYEDVERMIGEWRPGMNFPIDPKALKLAKEKGITYIILNGNKFENLMDLLDGKNFRGTVIKKEG